MKSKIIQIAVTSGGEDNVTDVMYALCEDGTIWCRIGPAEPLSRWTPVPIPGES